jgi:small subunit ribosomal protein S1
VRVADFGAFVELEPGIEGLAHASTFAPTGHSKGWAASVAVGTTAPFEILSIDLEKKRIALALVDEGSTRADTAAPPAPERAAGEPTDTARVDEVSSEAFGSLADKLKGALSSRRK